jgi:HD-GYP domain-containing protein (c-di-GMP phosphodiesterase class II)
LSGDSIPLHARIIGLVDCYDALTTDRTYRKALPRDFAIQIMEKETSAGLWDRELFKILRDILNTNKYNLAI